MNRNQVYYDISNIENKNAIYNLIFGEKSNGKSYQIKLYLLKKYINSGRRFVLSRRWESQLSQSWVEDYFKNMDISELTDKRYNSVLKRTNKIYFANITIDEEYKVKKVYGEQIGYAIPLSLEQNFSSADFTDCDDIVLEEFMERGVYIKNEVSKFQAFYSTVDRKRGTTKAWLIGNTITQANPYIYEWKIQKKVMQMKQGDIITIDIPTSDGLSVKMAIEYCKSSGGKSLAIGSSSSMIDKGSWQTEPSPHLPKSRKEYDKEYVIGFKYQGFNFKAELLADKKTSELVWFLYPYNYEFTEDEGILIFSDQIRTSQYYQRNIYDISFKNSTDSGRRIQRILDTFRECRVFYSDDLTATNFKQVIDFKLKL